MNGELPGLGRARVNQGGPVSGTGSGTTRRAPAPSLAEDSRLAVQVRGLVERDEMDEARERFGELVALHQRRASRIAFQYLRDNAEADEAVQDAFVKAFTHVTSYREAWPFDVWFTRILINGCLDRRKARSRRDRWFVAPGASAADEGRLADVRAAEPDPERALLAHERRLRVAAAVDRLDGRQRTVFVLCHYGDWTPRQVGVMTGLKESTVRVHLFRAVRRLRALLGGEL
jgi:RNA polymerase sigma-70 factor (ECF subfamily)